MKCIDWNVETYSVSDSTNERTMASNYSDNWNPHHRQTRGRDE